ncbi:hypothetical protein [Fictibacillus terranigra]|uniref:Uncharacterized protein n=1 Tax=Fictibacillus terranigra TaxID=3058424 RepID=A0ABT8EBS8_9BACL|nr:hypothetical protein [Fictibacillus sp. CENA-BCM004]MDN4075371.1 hypothetical protein [Fictibacillus sp. CENA-BCM004]
MDGMRVRFEIKNLHLRVGNVTRDSQSYVLFTAFDDSNNEIVLELTHEQAGFLEDQFYEANSRYEQRISPDQQPGPNTFFNESLANPHDQGNDQISN